ncbi:putative intracellular serine protease protein [Metarhizium brunneum]
MKELYPEVTILREGPTVQRWPSDANAARAEKEHPTKHEWIQCMKEFRKPLFDAESYHDSQEIKDGVEEPVKVALINDGVDAKDLEYSFIGGRTFCTRNEEYNLNDPYYVSSTGNGTIMAKRIHLLCPRAQFFVLRPEDHYSDEAGCQITARSAAQAILEAMRKSVHVISMSWTIDPPEDENERRCLEDAIVKAVDENKLVFFSASDKGAWQNATYPAKITSRIFTIGAATTSGAADDWVGNLDNINFTFPLSRVKLEGAPMFNRKDLLGKKLANFLKKIKKKKLLGL